MRLIRKEFFLQATQGETEARDAYSNVAASNSVPGFSMRCRSRAVDDAGMDSLPAEEGHLWRWHTPGEDQGGEWEWESRSLRRLIAILESIYMVSLR